MENEDYFTPKKVTFILSPSDADILLYAINHIDWSQYDEEYFGGEDSDAAGVHLCYFEGDLNNAFENLPYNENYY